MLGTIPHSYGADFAVFGRRGASNSDATEDSAPKMIANPVKTTIGRYWPTAKTYARTGMRSPDTFSRNMRSRRWSNQQRMKKMIADPNVIRIAGWRFAPKSRIMYT